MLPFAVLVFVVGGLLLVNAWAVVDAKMAASAAAREAARAYAEIPSGMSPAAAELTVRRRAEDVFRAAGVPAARTALAVTEGAGALRCAPVAVEATVTVPAITVPWIGGFGRAFAVHGRHRTIVDPFRSGLDGGSCG